MNKIENMCIGNKAKRKIFFYYYHPSSSYYYYYLYNFVKLFLTIKTRPYVIIKLIFFCRYLCYVRIFVAESVISLSHRLFLISIIKIKKGKIYRSHILCHLHFIKHENWSGISKSCFLESLEMHFFFIFVRY